MPWGRLLFLCRCKGTAKFCIMQVFRQKKIKKVHFILFWPAMEHASTPHGAQYIIYITRGGHAVRHPATASGITWARCQELTTGTASSRHPFSPSGSCQRWPAPRGRVPAIFGDFCRLLPTVKNPYTTPQGIYWVTWPPGASVRRECGAGSRVRVGCFFDVTLYVLQHFTLFFG